MLAIKKTAFKSGLAKVAVQYSAEYFLVNGSLVFKIKFCGKGPALRVAENR